MKHPIAWHEDCLVNIKDHQRREREKVDRLQKEIATRQELIELRELQIATAKQQKKDGFDPEKFLAKKVAGSSYSSESPIAVPPYAVKRN